MLQATAAARVVCLIVICWCTAPRGAESAIGVNWGILSFHKLKPSIVVHLLKDNKISKVKLFDADPDCIQALMGSGIQVMLGIPNEMLPLFSSSTDASDLWVRRNVSRYVVKNGVDIRFHPCSSHLNYLFLLGIYLYLFSSALVSFSFWQTVFNFARLNIYGKHLWFHHHFDRLIFI